MNASHSLALSGPVTPNKARHLEQALLGVAGVLDANVSASHGRVSITFDGARISLQDLQTALLDLEQAPTPAPAHHEGGCCGGCGG